MSRTIVLMMSVCLCAHAQKKGLNECDKWAAKGPKQAILRQILNEEKETRENRACIEESLESIRPNEDPTIIPTLISYLDYRSRFADVSPRRYAGRSPYPAIGALSMAGSSAIPHLLTVIKTEESSALRTKNAVEVFRALFPTESPEAIARLR